MTSGTAQAAHNAYMLVYEKRVKDPVTIVLDEQTVATIKQQQQSLVCDGTTIPRELESQHAFYAYPDLVSKVLKGEYSDDF